MSEFVPLRIAKKLKEKGFKEKCLTYYDAIDNVGLLYNTQYTNDLSPCQYTDLLQSHNTDVSAYQSDDSEYCVDAPTIAQVLKWLREEKKIYVGISYMPKVPNETGVLNDFYYPTFQKIGLFEPMFFIGNGKDYDTYEQATLAGIEYVLDNLI